MKDKAVLKELGKRLSEIAALPIQQQKKDLWIEHNNLKCTRPLVCIDQLPWHEINRSDEMKLECEDKFLRSIEWSIKSLLYRWSHFACDMVIENRIDIPMAVRDLKYGMNIKEDTLSIDKGNDIVSHQYHDMIKDDVALDAIQHDQIWVNRELDQKHLEICNDIFFGIIPVRLKGVEIHAGIWDRIAQMRPAESILWDIIDRPEFTKRVVKKFVDLTMSTVDQCEKLGILDADMQYVHCTGAYNDELPTQGFDPKKPRAKDCWAFGMAQIFSSMSPAMHDEFEIELVKPLYERFGLLYYGCCEPLESIIPYIKKVNNVRKISVSPWANIEKSAENIGNDYVFSSKPNPAFVTSGVLDVKEAKKQISNVLNACKKHGTPVELIFKDLSTVSGKLSCLDDWADMTMNMVCNID